MDTLLMRVRAWREGDVTELVPLANNRRLWEQLRDAFPHPYTEEAAREWISFASSHNPPTHFAIECDGVLVGSVGYVPGRDIERCSAEVGYWIGEPFWGRGLGTSALRVLIEMIADRGGFTRLFALPFADNPGSRRVLEKAGFTLDAILRHSAIKEGRVVDQALYSLVLPKAVS